VALALSTRVGAWYDQRQRNIDPLWVGDEGRARARIGVVNEADARLDAGSVKKPLSDASQEDRVSLGRFLPLSPKNRVMCDVEEEHHVQMVDAHNTSQMFLTIGLLPVWTGLRGSSATF
jgi:hypothetical protein